MQVIRVELLLLLLSYGLNVFKVILNGIKALTFRTQKLFEEDKKVSMMFIRFENQTK